MRHYPGQRPAVASVPDRQVPRAPLPLRGVTSSGMTSSAISKGVTPSSSLIRAHASDQNPPAAFRPWPRSAGPCRLLPAPAERWPFPTLSLQVFPKMPGSRSRRGVGCTCLFLPQRHRPSPHPAHGSASRVGPLRDFTAAGVSRSSPFLTFRPPGLFATQVSPTATA